MEISGTPRILLRDRAPVRGEPLAVGLPLPRGAYRDARSVALQTRAGAVVPCQGRVLDQWPDGSVRWIHIAWQGDPNVRDLAVAPGSAKDGLPLAKETGERISLGPCATLAPGTAFPTRELNGRLEWAPGDGSRRVVRFEEVELLQTGPLRARARLRGRVDGIERLAIEAIVMAGAGWPLLEISLRAHNQAAARHPGGIWELGDPGSLRFRCFRWCWPTSGGTRYSAAPGAPWTGTPGPLELTQHGSGGLHWNSPVHVDASGAVSVRRRGGEIRTSAGIRDHARLLPAIATSRTALTMPRFWQEFPKRIRVEGDEITYELWPECDGEPHELQGGESKTHVLFAGHADRPVDPEILEAARCPLAPAVAAAAHADEWYALIRADQDPDGARLTIMNACLDERHGVEAKRETIDEYGWRHYGDLWADHEAVSAPCPQSFASHYNNQYDALEGFLVRYLATGDSRWWRFADDLARHVVDIDLYTTTQDRAAYSGGQFWHTAHHVEAARSTHRSYPAHRQIPGGGPANEHVYTSGLLLHHLLTGSERSREAVIQLADYVVRMDDGRLAPLALLDRGATGKASVTREAGYHGPGRGAANSINALLDAHRLTREPRYLAKADELVRRCIHPEDDLAAFDLLDREARWSYTVFANQLGKYLDYLRVAGHVDQRFAYAQACLVHLGRWIAEHESPYLDRAEDLEFPTETWAAQELRKSDALYRAAAYEEPNRRLRLLERAAFFHDVAFEHLERFETRTFTRPVVITLTCGFLHAMVAVHGLADRRVELAPALGYGRRVQFTDRKKRIKRRVLDLAGAALVLAAAVAALLWARR